MCNPFAGCHQVVQGHLNWRSKSELKAEVMHDLQEIGSSLYLMWLLDTAMVGTVSLFPY